MKAPFLKRINNISIESTIPGGYNGYHQIKIGVLFYVFVGKLWAGKFDVPFFPDVDLCGSSDPDRNFHA